MLRTDIVCNIIINITIISNMIKRASNIKLIIIDLKIALELRRAVKLMFEGSLKGCYSNKQFGFVSRVTLSIIRTFDCDEFFTKPSSFRARAARVCRKKFVSGLNKEDRVSRSCGKPVAPAAEVRDDP